jgi:hypothetical protein
MTNHFSRTQILMATGVVIAGAIVASSVPLLTGNAPAQAQTGGISSFKAVRLSSDFGFGIPHLAINQENTNDFARIRFSNSGNIPAWDIAVGPFPSKNAQVMNFFNSFGGNVMTLRTNGNLEIKGALQQGSSRTLKKNISELSSQEAMKTLAGLNPVKFRYKADTQKANHVGFIAEDVPDLVATPDRKGLNSMDIVGVLTKAVQEQQKTILDLSKKVESLERQNAAN